MVTGPIGISIVIFGMNPKHLRENTLLDSLYRQLLDFFNKRRIGFPVFLQQTRQEALCQVIDRIDGKMKIRIIVVAYYACEFVGIMIVLVVDNLRVSY
jgi:hypothetical protein